MEKDGTEMTLMEIVANEELEVRRREWAAVAAAKKALEEGRLSGTNIVTVRGDILQDNPRLGEDVVSLAVDAVLRDEASRREASRRAV